MRPCACEDEHSRKRIVLTGGPGAGKTAVLELIRQYFCKHVRVLPESASILFGGGFPRGNDPGTKRAAQRAIFYVQRELERGADDGDKPAIVLCDRGTVDGSAYWTGPGELWPEVGTTREDELRRYDAVLHLRTPGDDTGYDRSNPVRIESASEAMALDNLILAAWDGHPRRFVVESRTDFMEKAHRAVELLRGELPACCRHHMLPGMVPGGRS